MRKPAVSLRRPQFRRPALNRAMAPKIALGLVAIYGAIVGLMSIFSGVHDRFAWVPVRNDQVVLDSALKLLLGIVLIALAVAVILPLSMAIHTVGHAAAGYFFGMRLLAVRLGPLLVTPWSIGNRFEILPMAAKRDWITGWVQFDDSPLATWKRIRGWQVMTGGGSLLNFAFSFVFALLSFFAGGVTYVLFREMVWINLAVALVNVIPFTISRYEFESDGKRLLGLFFDEGDGAEALVERLRNEVVVGPLRPASWPRERESAWEAQLRKAPATDEGRAEQMETMVYLFLQGVDRGDKDVAWRWVQAMHHLIGVDRTSEDVAIDTGRVMCALYAARWEKNAAGARELLDAVSTSSGMRFSPWYSVARAATAAVEAMADTPPLPEKLLAAEAAAKYAEDQLRNPAKLHGVDQLMLGITQAIAGDIDLEMQKHQVTQPQEPKPVLSPEAAAAAFSQTAVA